MRNREQIKNILATLWPKSRLAPEVLGEIITRLDSSRLSIEQIDALLRAHRMECQKASWSPEAWDITRRINATRSNSGAVARVDDTQEKIKAEANELRWAKLVNTKRRDRVLAAIQCMELSELDAFVTARIPEASRSCDQAKYTAQLWEWAKGKLGNPQTWTVERVANCQPARVVLCRVLGIDIETPAYDRSKTYPTVSNPAGFDNSLAKAEIGFAVASESKSST